MKKYGFVYIWYDRKHKKFYIGSHWGIESDGYICSSRWMRKSYNRRKSDFKRRIISRIYTTKLELLDEEYRWLSMIPIEELGKKYYNLTQHRNGHWTAEEYEKDIKKRISQKTKEAMQRPEVREKYMKGLETRDNQSSNPEVIEKRKQSMIKTMAEKFPVENRLVRMEFGSQEYRDTMANIVSDRWKQDEYKKKVGDNISKALKGKPHPHVGVPKSKETRNKISESKLQIDKYRDDIIATMHMKATKAAKILGIHRHSVMKYRQMCSV